MGVSRMNEIQETIDRLSGALAGLFLVHNIKVDKGGGKIIVDLLHKLEKQIADILKG